MERIGIIDLDSCVFSIGYAKDCIKSNKQLEEHSDLLMNSILTKSECTGYIGYIKGNETIKDRLVFNSEYKQNRKSGKPEYWEYVKQYLIDKWNAIEVHGMEVDDAVNITRLKLENSSIIAIDKDLLTLEGRHYNWRKDEWNENDKNDAAYNFWCSMITGDVADNIKGIPKKGIKFAENLLTGVGHNSIMNELIFHEYLKEFGSNKGIEEFYKNYKSLRMLDEKEGFIIPEVIKYDMKENNEEENEVWK